MPQLSKPYFYFNNIYSFFFIVHFHYHINYLIFADIAKNPTSLGYASQLFFITGILILVILIKQPMPSLKGIGCLVVLITQYALL
jgi:hypothetical protein